MRLRVAIWGLLLGSVSGCSGESQDVQAPAEVEFEWLEQTTYPGYVLASPDAVCDLAAEPAVLHLDAAAGILTWRRCERSADGLVTLSDGGHTLFGDQLSRVRQALARIKPREGLCAFDGSDHLLDVVTVEGMQQMGDAVGGGACHDPPEGRYAGRALVEGIPALSELLASLPGGG